MKILTDNRGGDLFQKIRRKRQKIRNFSPIYGCYGQFFFPKEGGFVEFLRTLNQIGAKQRGVDLSRFTRYTYK